MSPDFLLIALTLSNGLGIILYAWLFFILMEVVICKDVKLVDTHQLLSRKLSVRLRLFRRSMGDNFYRGSLCLFFGCFGMILIHIARFSQPAALDYAQPIVALLLPAGLIFLYRHLGYQVPLFRKNHRIISL